MRMILKQTSIIIQDYNMGDCPILERFFTQYDKLTHQYYMQCIYYNEDKKELIIPRGIDVTYVEQMLGITSVIDKKYDAFDIVDSFKIKYGPRDEVQKEALRFMLGTDEYSNTANASQLNINLNTGAGKTYVAIATSIIMGIKPIVIASTSGWIDQWRARFLEYTNIKPSEIYTIQGSASISRILQNIAKAPKYSVFLATHNTIKSYGDKYGWDKITELFKRIKVGIKIFDEAHLNFDNLCMIDFHTNTYKTYYLTATPMRSDRQEDLLYRLYFKNVYAIDLFNKDTDPRTHYIAIHFKSKPTAIEISNCHNVYGLNRNNYSNYLVNKPSYYQLLRVLMNILIKLNGKVLIYIGTNDAIFKTREWLVENYPDLAKDIGVYTSIVPKEEKALQLERRFILSTTKSAGAASDIKGLKAVVVLNEPFKSKVLARQTLGRTRDRNTYYFDIIDDSFVDIRRYYNAKKKIFSVYALDCKDINLNNNLDTMAELANVKHNLKIDKPLKTLYRKLR